MRTTSSLLRPLSTRAAFATRHACSSLANCFEFRLTELDQHTSITSILYPPKWSGLCAWVALRSVGCAEKLRVSFLFFSFPFFVSAHCSAVAQRSTRTRIRTRGENHAHTRALFSFLAASASPSVRRSVCVGDGGPSTGCPPHCACATGRSPLHRGGGIDISRISQLRSPRRPARRGRSAVRRPVMAAATSRSRQQRIGSPRHRKALQRTALVQQQPQRQRAQPQWRNAFGRHCCIIRLCDLSARRSGRRSFRCGVPLLSRFRVPESAQRQGAQRKNVSVGRRGRNRKQRTAMQSGSAEGQGSASSRGPLRLLGGIL